ncbi:MAG: hypothetical protein AB8G05_15755 [Oligoflexales bacterium]
MFKIEYLWLLISAFFITLGTKPSYGATDANKETKVDFLKIEELDNLNVQLKNQINIYHKAIIDNTSKIQKPQQELDRTFLALFLTYESFLNFGYSKSLLFHNEVLKEDQNAYRNFLDYRDSFDSSSDTCSWQEASFTVRRISMQFVNFDIPNQLVQKIGDSLNKQWQVQTMGQLHNIMGQLQSIHGKTSEQVGEHLEVASELIVLNELTHQQKLFLEVFRIAYQLLDKIPNIVKAQTLSQTIDNHESDNDYLKNAVSLFSTFMEEE